jgi:hypothetical protein
MMRSACAGVLLLCVAIWACAACSKDEPPPPQPVAPAASSSPVAVTSAVPSATATPSASPTPTAPAASSVAEAPLASATSGAKKPAASASASVKGAPTCGDKPLPPCPLYAWMKANTSAAMSSQDFDGLAAALTKTASFAPPGYTNWVSISKDGADAARAQSLDGVKGACRGCHNQYKDRYKKELRDRPI